MIASTNKHAYPNTLIVILGQDKGRSHYEEKGQVTRVLDEDNKVIGFNFFNVDQYLNYDALNNGEVTKVFYEIYELSVQERSLGRVLLINSEPENVLSYFVFIPNSENSSK